jgi:D-xylose 1-dehydrogenase (NADP+, D-xylono-1,5-lactone-forming)
MAWEKLRVGVVGAGDNTRKFHIPRLQAIDGVEVVSVANRSRASGERVAQQFGIPTVYDSWPELVAAPDTDAIVIGTWPYLHCPVTLAALAAGKHVLCEKPLSPRAEEVERCFDAAERAGLVLSEGFMWRHHPQAERLESLVRGGAIGELRLVRAAFSFPLDRFPDVRWDAELDGGALLDVGCYCVSGARLLAGAEPERVTGESVLADSGVDSRFAGTLRFPGDVLAVFDCGFDIAPRDELEAIGSSGSLFLDDPWHSAEPRIELRAGSVELVEVERANPYRLELEDVSAAIREEREPRLGRADAVGQARALEALMRSAAEGRPVAVA